MSALPAVSAGRALTALRGSFSQQGARHFPGNPVVPGVVLCEIMGQTCCVLLADKISGRTPYFTGIDRVKFRNQVHPGDTIEMHCSIKRMLRNFYFTECAAYVNGKLCASGELSFALVK